jgi:hypothetical protein
MRVPQEMLDKWKQLSKREICEQLAKMLSIGAFYSEKGMEFLLRRERTGEVLRIAQHLLDTLNQFGISIEGKTITELLNELKMIYLKET